jgi:hypothetical protein
MIKNVKRDPIKHVRDRAKAKYDKGTECEICGSTEKLDFHHYYTLTPLFNKWVKKNKLSIDTDEKVVAIRDQFISEHSYSLPPSPYEITFRLRKGSFSDNGRKAETLGGNTER